MEDSIPILSKLYYNKLMAPTPRYPPQSSPYLP